MSIYFLEPYFKEISTLYYKFNNAWYNRGTEIGIGYIDFFDAAKVAVNMISREYCSLLKKNKTR